MTHSRAAIKKTAGPIKRRTQVTPVSWILEWGIFFRKIKKKTCGISWNFRAVETQLLISKRQKGYK